MVKLNTKISKPLPTFHVGLIGKISKVEVVKTKLRGLDAVRVVLSDTNCEESNDGSNEHSDVLWLRERVSKNSKLGAFISVLGDDTDKWIGRTIVFDRWQEKDRKIQVVE